MKTRTQIRKLLNRQDIQAEPSAEFQARLLKHTQEAERIIKEIQEEMVTSLKGCSDYTWDLDDHNRHVIELVVKILNDLGFDAELIGKTDSMLEVFW